MGKDPLQHLVMHPQPVSTSPLPRLLELRLQTDQERNGVFMTPG